MPETRTAVISLNDDGLVMVRVRAGTQQSIEDARTNLAAAVAETGGQRRPVLIDIRIAEPLQSAVRHCYTGQALADGFLAMAILVESSPFGRMMGNIYLRVARAGISTQLFTDESRAVQWLIQSRG